MSNVRFLLALPLLIALVLIALGGCEQKQQASLEKQVEQAADVVQKAAEKTAVQALQDTTSTATKTWSQGAQNLRQGGVALRVKSALALSSRLEGAGIDADLQGNSIVLSGEVLTYQQKTVAQSLAQNIVDPKFKIVNRLKVVGLEAARNTRTIKAKGY